MGTHQRRSRRAPRRNSTGEERSANAQNYFRALGCSARGDRARRRGGGRVTGCRTCQRSGVSPGGRAQQPGRASIAPKATRSRHVARSSLVISRLQYCGQLSSQLAMYNQANSRASDEWRRPTNRRACVGSSEYRSMSRSTVHVSAQPAGKRGQPSRSRHPRSSASSTNATPATPAASRRPRPQRVDR